MTKGSGQAVRVKVLSRLVYEKRREEGWTLEEVAEETGISPATLSRLERQRDSDKISLTPSTETVTALARWLRVPIETVLDVEPSHSDAPQKVGEHLRAVEMHLRARKNLDAESMRLLGTIFNLAYQQASSALEQSAEDEAET